MIACDSSFRSRRWIDLRRRLLRRRRNLAYDEPVFVVALLPSVPSWLPIYMWDADTPVSFLHAVYRWSRPLRRWVFDPRRSA
jgi:hypothetical protein